MSVFRNGRSNLLAAMMLASVFFSANSIADTGYQLPTLGEAAKVNNNTVGVVFTHEELYHQLVHNMQHELEPSSGLRIVPVMGTNHVQSVYDLLFLKGIDLALVRADAIEYVKRVGKYHGVQRVVESVSKVSDEKIIVVASKDYNSLKELDGQVVGHGSAGSGTFVTSTLVFQTLEIEPVYIEVDSLSAIEKVQSGELAAMVYLLKASDAVQSDADLEVAKAIAEINSSGKLHIIEISGNEELDKVYSRTLLGNEELPDVIASGDSIKTYAVDTILAAYRWERDNPRSKRVGRFTNALVENLEKLQSGDNQPVWKRLDLSLITPSILRSPMIDEAIANKEAEAARMEAEKQQLIAEKIHARELAAAAAEEKKLAALSKQRDELTKRLARELKDADAAELELMLENLDSFLEPEDGEGEYK
ncbi:MAG: hypothetical protein V3U76_18810 [Granulosicoccus sp.]